MRIEKKTNMEVVSCVLSILKAKTEDEDERKIIVFLAEDKRENDVWEKIIIGSDEQRIIVSTQHILNNYERHVYVFFVKAGRTFQDILYFADKRSYFIGISDDTYSRDLMYNFFKQFFDASIEDVLLLIPNGNGVYLYTSYPYSETHCNQCGPPVLVNTFMNGHFSRKYNLFPFKKHWNLYGCEVIGIGNRQPPDALMVVGKRGEIKFTKITKEILTMLSRKMNFKPKIVTSIRPSNNASLEHSWFFYNDSVELIINHLEKELVEFAIGHFSWLAFSGNKHLQLGKESRTECYTWAIPSRAGKRRSYITSYINEFDSLSWILFGNILLFTFVVLYLIRLFLRQNRPYQSAANVLSYIVATVLNQPMFIRPRSMSLRVFLCHWFAYVLVITTAYQATLWSFLTIPWQVDDIHTIQELAESSLKFGGGPQMLSILKRMNANKDIKKIIEKFTLLQPSGFQEIIGRIERDRDIAIFGERQHMEYYAMKYSKANHRYAVQIMEGCVTQTVATPFLVKNGSPLYRPMNQALTQILQTGFMRKMKSYYGFKRTFSTKLTYPSESPLRMDTFEGIFFILIMGYVLATLVFILEVVFKCLERRNKLLIIKGTKLCNN